MTVGASLCSGQTEGKGAALGISRRIHPALARRPRQQVLPKIWVTPETSTNTKIGKPEPKVDAVKLVQGKPAFTDDIEMRGMLVAKILHSPVAHAWI